MRRLAKTDENLSDARVPGWSVIRAVLPYLWPEGDKGVKIRVVTSLLALFLSQIIAVVTPIFFSQAVDVWGGYIFAVIASDVSVP